jgi:hypothetical protein
MPVLSTARICGLALALASGLAVEAATRPPRLTPTSGSTLFRYEVRQTIGGEVSGWRMNYRLQTDGRGGAVAVVLQSEALDHGAWSPVTVDPSCRTAMHAGPGELAEVRLAPLSTEAAALGDAFLALCAPSGVFNPITDILNVALIQTSKPFRIDALRRDGDTVAFAGFSTSLSRPTLEMSEASDGGEISLVGVEEGRALVDWKPTPSRLHLVNKLPSGQQVPLDGTEHFAFRLEIDARTGQLRSAHSLYDDLDLTAAVAGLPADRQPRLKITREVAIAPVD